MEFVCCLARQIDGTAAAAAVDDDDDDGGSGGDDGANVVCCVCSKCFSFLDFFFGSIKKSQCGEANTMNTEQ